MSKSYNPRRAKVHRSYTVAEAARIFSVTRAAVRAWIKAGVPTVQTTGPLLILGADLQAFHATRQAARRRICPAGTIYCLRCREPRRPDPTTLVVVLLEPKSGNLRGQCLACGAGVNRRVSLARLAELGFGEARQTHRQLHLVDSPPPSLKHDSKRTPRHAQAKPRK